MTRFAADLLEARRLGEQGAPKLPVRIMQAGDTLDLGPFAVEIINVAHSIPEILRACHYHTGRHVLHTGDWKIDETPRSACPTDEKRLREIGAAVVLAMICDSTNVIRDGSSPSEADVGKEIAAIIAESKGKRVAVTTFASNVAR